MKPSLIYFRKNSDHLEGRITIIITEAELTRLFNTKKELLVCADFKVKKSHSNYFFVRDGTKLDLNTYDYFLSCEEE